jgi:hypothetical protein
MLRENDSETLLLQAGQEEGPDLPPKIGEYASQPLSATAQNWRNWASRCTYAGRWREMAMG